MGRFDRDEVIALLRAQSRRRADIAVADPSLPAAAGEYADPNAAAASGGTDPAPGVPKSGAIAGIDETDAVVEEAVRRVNRMVASRGLDAALAVGRVVLDIFFGGDLARYRSRDGQTFSFRRFANHPDLQVHPSTIRNAIAVLEQLPELPEEVRDELSFSHHKVLLPLSRSDKRRLALLSVQEAWSVERLDAAVRRLHEREPPPPRTRAGRPRLPAFVKTLRRWQRELAEAERGGPDPLGEQDAIDDLGPRERARYYSGK